MNLFFFNVCSLYKKEQGWVTHFVRDQNISVLVSLNQLICYSIENVFNLSFFFFFFFWLIKYWH